jgi:hypothetical protein
MLANGEARRRDGKCNRVDTVSDTRVGGLGRRNREEDGKPKRGGSLARDKPTFLLIETLRHRSKACFGMLRLKCGRGDAATVASRQEGRGPWRDENPGEDRLR